MKTNRTQWSILDPVTQEHRAVDADECFPIKGRLLSGVWQLDDGRVLIAMTAHDTVGDAQPTMRVEYVDPERGAVRVLCGSDGRK